MRLQEGRVDEVVGIDDTLGQSSRHLAVVNGIDNLLWIVLALLPSVATDVVDHPYEGEFAVHLIINTVGDGTAGFTEHDVLLSHPTVAHHRAHQGQRHEGRRVELYGVVVGDGVVQVQLHGDALTVLISSVAPSMGLVEVTEERPPCLLSRRLSRQLHHSLGDHCVGLLLVVPAVFHPEPGLAVPLGHTWCMYPRHAPRMDATAFANRLVGSDEEMWRLWIELAEEHTVAVHRLVQQLDGR